MAEASLYLCTDARTAQGDLAEFLDAAAYPALLRWADRIAARPAVQRGRIVNRLTGNTPLPERHSGGDVDAALAVAQVNA